MPLTTSRARRPGTTSRARLLGALAVLWLSLAPALAQGGAEGCRGPSLLDALAPAERAAIEDAAARAPHGEGLIWRARKGAAEIVLVGTMHLSDPRLGAVMDRVRPHVERADRVLLEATEVEIAALGAHVAADPSRILAPEGPSLTDRLSPEDWAVVSAAARERGIPGVLAARYRPAWLSMALAVPACAIPADGAVPEGLDRMIEREARAHGAAVGALEPFDTVLRALSGLPAEAELRMLVAGARGSEDGEGAMVALLDLYFAGRMGGAGALNRIALERMDGLTPADVAAAAALFDTALIADRNRAWIPVIEAAAATGGRVLAAFGAAHLPGEDGVPSLLEEAGWTVDPLPASRRTGVGARAARP